jgi:hypothetical protein
MPRRRRVGSRFRPMSELELAAAETMLATGPDWGAHSVCNEAAERAECAQLAQLWSELREYVMFEAGSDLGGHFCYVMLELDAGPPHRLDPRLSPHDPRQDQYAAHQRCMAGWLREAFERVGGA